MAFSRPILVILTTYSAVIFYYVAAQQCSTGLPAFITCNQDTQVCDADATLACEDLDGTYYCCPPVETTTKPTTTRPPTTTTYVCRDNATYCASQSALCTNAIYQETMYSQCRVTCKQCGTAKTAPNAASTVAGCADIYTTCAANSGLCSNANYSLIMPIYCKKTCKLC